MAPSDKCPRCDCEGIRLACEICYYFGFKCPGNCECCADRRKELVKPTKPKVQKEPIRKAANGRLLTRPLILRSVKKALADSQKENGNVSQSNRINSTVSESNKSKFLQVNLAGKPNSKKSNPTVKHSSSKKVKAGKQFYKPKVTYVVLPELSEIQKEAIRKDKEEEDRRRNQIFWPQYNKAPCFSPEQSKILKREQNVISPEKLHADINEMIGEHCLNCQCRNTRESCNTCKRSDFQCLGSCVCCSSFRKGQKYIIFMRESVFIFPDGFIHGGGNVYL